MNVKHFYLESFVTLIGIFSYNFNKSANAHPKVWLHTLPMEASGMELNLVSRVRVKDLRAVPMYPGGSSHHCRWEKETFVPWGLCFPQAGVLPGEAGSEACWRGGRDGSSLGATLPGRGQASLCLPPRAALSSPSRLCLSRPPRCTRLLACPGSCRHRLPGARYCPRTHALCCFLSRAVLGGRVFLRPRRVSFLLSYFRTSA